MLPVKAALGMKGDLGIKVIRRKPTIKTRLSDWFHLIRRSTTK